MRGVRHCVHEAGGAADAHSDGREDHRVPLVPFVPTAPPASSARSSGSRSRPSVSSTSDSESRRRSRSSPATTCRRPPTRRRRSSASCSSRAWDRRLLEGRADHDRVARWCSACCCSRTGRRSARTRKPAARTWSLATTSGSCRRRSPGVALLTDYILTVSVSVSAGTAALTSVYEGLHPWRVPISLGVHRHPDLRGTSAASANRAGSSPSPRTSSSLMMGVLLGDVASSACSSGTLPSPRRSSRCRRRQSVAGFALDLPRAQGVRLRRRRRHRGRGDLQRRARVQAAGMEERHHHPHVDGGRSSARCSSASRSWRPGCTSSPIRTRR